MISSIYEWQSISMWQADRQDEYDYDYVAGRQVMTGMYVAGKT